MRCFLFRDTWIICRSSVERSRRVKCWRMPHWRRVSCLTMPIHMAIQDRIVYRAVNRRRRRLSHPVGLVKRSNSMGHHTFKQRVSLDWESAINHFRLSCGFEPDRYAVLWFMSRHSLAGEVGVFPILVLLEMDQSVSTRTMELLPSL